MTTKKTDFGQDANKAWAITHVAFEDLGSFEQILRENGFEVEYLSAVGDDLEDIRPDTDELVIILGGPISVNDVEEYPFLDTEMDLLRQRLAADKPTLGICLGAQLIARSEFTICTKSRRSDFEISYWSSKIPPLMMLNKTL